MAKYGKRTTAARAAFAGKAIVTVEEAVALVKANATRNSTKLSKSQ